MTASKRARALGQAELETDPRFDIPVMSAGFKTRPEDAWEHYTPVYNYTFIADPRNHKMIENRLWSAGMAIFGAQSVCASVYDHTQDHVAESGHLVCVHRFLEGTASGLHDDQPFSTPPYTVGIRDYSRPYKGIQTPGYSEAVYLLPSAIHFDPGQHRGTLAYAPSSTMGRVLNAEFDYFFGQLNAGAQTISRARFNRMVGCFTVAVNGAYANEDVRVQAREALGDLICDYIEEHLHLPTLTTKSILDEFGVSRASLYRIFEREGGVRNYISMRRLFRAVGELATKPTVRGEISKVAEHWGFSSNANFHRSVKTAFGVKPGSLFEYPIGFWTSRAGKTRLTSFFDDATGLAGDLTAA